MRIQNGKCAYKQFNQTFELCKSKYKTYVCLKKFDLLFQKRKLYKFGKHNDYEHTKKHRSTTLSVN